MLYCFFVYFILSISICCRFQISIETDKSVTNFARSHFYFCKWVMGHCTATDSNTFCSSFLKSEISEKNNNSMLSQEFYLTRVTWTSKNMYSPGTSFLTSWTRLICCLGPNPAGKGPGFPSSKPVTYARLGGIKIRLVPPCFMPRIASSNPAIAVLSPTVKMNGTPFCTSELSTKYPFDFRSTLFQKEYPSFKIKKHIYEKRWSILREDLFF